MQRTIEFIVVNADEQEMKEICQEFCVEYSGNKEQNIESVIEKASSHQNLVKITMPYLIKFIDKKNRSCPPKWYREIIKKVKRANIGEVILKDTNPFGIAIRTADPSYGVSYLGVLLISYMRNKQLNY